MNKRDGLVLAGIVTVSAILVSLMSLMANGVIDSPFPRV
jgi:hypothetical protein